MHKPRVKRAEGMLVASYMLAGGVHDVRCICWHSSLVLRGETDRLVENGEAVARHTCQFDVTVEKEQSKFVRIAKRVQLHVYSDKSQLTLMGAQRSRRYSGSFKDAHSC